MGNIHYSKKLGEYVFHDNPGTPGGGFRQRIESGDTYRTIDRDRKPGIELELQAMR